MDRIRAEHQASIRRACRVAGISGPLYRYKPDKHRDAAVIHALQDTVEDYPAHGFGKYGFGKLFTIMRRKGHTFNHKHVHRVHRLLNLNKRRRGIKRIPNRNPTRLQVAETINECWSMDFMSDSLHTGRPFRTFNVLDDFNRKVLATKVDLNLPAARVIRVLDRIADQRGCPAKVRTDKGPKFTSVALADWAEAHDIEPEFIQPGKPTQNSYFERFNRTYRDEILNLYVFRTLAEVRQITTGWIDEYNQERPYDSLEKLTPIGYLDNYKSVENSNWICN